jgi:hypothetical protein
VSYVALPAGEGLADRAGRLAAALQGISLTVQDGAGTVPVASDRPPAAAAAVMDRLKARFDPARVLPPGSWAIGGEG